MGDDLALGFGVTYEGLKHTSLTFLTLPELVFWSYL